jgi:two-component system cell cycle sensor histidine kinase/response regulator CckA
MNLAARIPISGCFTNAAALMHSFSSPGSNLVDSLPIIVWTADARTFRFTYVSEGAERLLGYPVERWLEEPSFWRDHLHPDDRGVISLCHAETGACRDHELLYRMIAADGRLVWLRDKVQVRTEDGAAAELSGVMFDVTAEMEADRALRRSEERYRQLVEGVSDVIYTLDPEGRITSLNGAFETLSGLKIADWMGRPFTELLLPECIDRATEHFQLSLHGNAPLTASAYRMRAASGAVREIEIAGQQRVPGDPAQGTIGMARDVTERNVLARRLEETKRLASLGDLAATMAHEMNNVLMAIQPYCEVLVRQCGNAGPAASAGRSIATTIDRGRRITSEILDYNMPRAPKTASIDPQPWMTEVTGLIEPLLPETVALRIDTRLHDPITGDQQHLEQIITNLVVNAVHAMPDGGLLTLELTADADPRHHPFGLPPAQRFARLTVRDTGHGIPPDLLPQIFNPLFTTKRRGTGLGLAIAKRLIEAQGGAITAESAGGVGTAFHVLIPMQPTTFHQAGGVDPGGVTEISRG